MFPINPETLADKAVVAIPLAVGAVVEVETTYSKPTAVGAGSVHVMVAEVLVIALTTDVEFITHAGGVKV